MQGHRYRMSSCGREVSGSRCCPSPRKSKVTLTSWTVKVVRWARQNLSDNALSTCDGARRIIALLQHRETTLTMRLIAVAEEWLSIQATLG